jgi:hypothetical protein
MSRFLLALAALMLLAVPGAQAIEDDGSCVYNRRVFPEGYEMCQAGTLKRCEDGAWSDVGDCPDEPMEPPRPGGGDEPEEERLPGS